MENLYFIALIPEKAICDEITGFQLDFKENFSSKKALNTPPHITMFPPFKMDDTQSKDFEDSLERFCGNTNQFAINLNGFAVFAPRVIYVAVEKSQDLNSLYNNLNSFMTRNFHFESKDHGREFTPHITVAYKDLTKDNFMRGWNKYKSRTFLRGFSANRLSLLIHKDHMWVSLKDFELNQ